MSTHSQDEYLRARPHITVFTAFYVWARGQKGDGGPLSSRR
jgi:hypothetical protein